MNNKAHIVAGITLGLIFYLYTKNFWIFPVAIVYSVLPDIDIRTSSTFKWYVVLAAIFIIYCFTIPATITWFGLKAKYFGIIALVFLAILQFFHHREFFHSIAAGIILALPLYFLLGKYVFIGAVASFYLHLFLDDELFDGIWT